jgi:hypothetical protein
MLDGEIFIWYLNVVVREAGSVPCFACSFFANLLQLLCCRDFNREVTPKLSLSPNTMVGVAITCLPCLWDCLTAIESALLAARVRGMIWLIRSRLFIGMIGCPDPSWANACSADPFYTEVSRLDCVCLVWSGLFWSFVAVCCVVLCFCIWVLVFIAECVQCCRRVFWSRGSGNSE